MRTKTNKKYGANGGPIDQFTYRRRCVDGVTLFEFLNNGEPIFKNFTPCTADQALGLVRQLNAIHPKYLNRRGHEVITMFFKRLKTEVETGLNVAGNEDKNEVPVIL